MTDRQKIRRTPPGAPAIAEGALLADLTVLVVLIGLYIPYAGPAMAAISPLPLLLLVLRQGWRVGIQAFFAAALLVTFLTGPFTSFAVFTIALRAFALAIGLRRGWSAGRTILAGAAFLWVIVCTGVAAAALLLPSWRAATEQGMAVTYKQVTGLLGLLLRIVGQRHLWQQLSPQLNDLLPWLLAHWLILLPFAAFPLLTIVVGAEYIIVELALPRLGIKPPPLRLPLIGAFSSNAAPAPGNMRRRLERRLEGRMATRREKSFARNARTFAPASIDAGLGSPADQAARSDAIRRVRGGTAIHHDGGSGDAVADELMHE